MSIIVVLLGMVCIACIIVFAYDVSRKKDPPKALPEREKERRSPNNQSYNDKALAESTQFVLQKKYIQELERENKDLREQITRLSQRATHQAVKASNTSGQPFQRPISTATQEAIRPPTPAVVASPSPTPIEKPSATVQRVFTAGESKLLELYNQDYSQLDGFAITLGQTRSSLEKYFYGASSPVQLELNDSGKYWAILSSQIQNGLPIYYLMLRKDIQLNQQNLSAVEACYRFGNRAASSKDFEIIHPAAAVSVKDQNNLWKLTWRGQARFKDT